MSDVLSPVLPANMDELNDKLQLYADMSAELDPLRPAFKELDALEKQLKEQIRELGQSYDHPAVFAEWKPGHNRTNWNGKALEAYAAMHPEVLEYRRQSTTRPYVKLLLKGG